MMEVLEVRPQVQMEAQVREVQATPAHLKIQKLS